jgi:hypothetical protein
VPEELTPDTGFIVIGTYNEVKDFARCATLAAGLRRLPRGIADPTCAFVAIDNTATT